jgi:Protein of unknown function (DUF1329)
MTMRRSEDPGRAYAARAAWHDRCTQLSSVPRAVTGRCAAIWSVALGIAATSLAAENALTPGSILDQGNAAAAESLLPPELLAHYRTGEYRNAIGRWPEVSPWERAFAAASEANARRLTVDGRGTIVERDSSRAARGLYGLPFRIDPADPHAGVKVVWNAYYALWRMGSMHDTLGLAWIGKRGLEREATLESHMLFYEGVPPARAPKKNPLDLASQQRAVAVAPADLHAMASLTWRFRSADQRDQAWIYVPALRRVRQVSAANRSDGFLGSDLSQDDGTFFDGKPEDFTWKLVGEREALVLADPRSLASSAVRRGRPDGGVDEAWPVEQKVVGYQDPGWRGLPWAPLAPILVRRKLWVVEAVPRDPYYLFARIELGLDEETFQGATSRKFDGQGRLLRSLQFLLYASQPIEAGGEQLLLPASSMGYIVAENTKAERATVVGTVPRGGSVHERRVQLDPDLFSLERLSAGQ